MIKNEHHFEKERLWTALESMYHVDFSLRHEYMAAIFIIPKKYEMSVILVALV